MSLYEIIDEIAEKQVVKSDTGDARVYGVMLGLVAKNYDKNMPGRVCVTIPTRDKEANELQWVRVAQPSGGKKWGHYFLPEVGDQVLLAFEGGNIEKPYIIGSLCKDNDRFLGGSVDKDNKTKRIVTKNGNNLTFTDGAEEDGSKDIIELETAGQKHWLKLDNANNQIELTNKSGNNSIKMRTEDGSMTVKASSRLTIEIGDKIKIIMNGETGVMKVTCDELNVAASRKAKVKTDGMLKVDAGQLSMAASSMCKIESNGMVTIAGNPIKVG